MTLLLWMSYTTVMTIITQNLCYPQKVLCHMNLHWEAGMMLFATGGYHNCSRHAALWERPLPWTVPTAPIPRERSLPILLSEGKVMQWRHFVNRRCNLRPTDSLSARRSLLLINNKISLENAWKSEYFHICLHYIKTINKNNGIEI